LPLLNLVMNLGSQVILLLGIIQLTLFIISLFIIGLNKEMSTIGRVLRCVLIMVFPILGPFLVIFQVLRWRLQREERRKAQ
jgi:hypothetical protein